MPGENRRKEKNMEKKIRESVILLLGSIRPRKKIYISHPRKSVTRSLVVKVNMCINQIFFKQ